MELNIGPRETLMIDDARIVYRNFKGEGSKFNAKGDRNFAIVIPNQDIADQLSNLGWNVKIKPPRNDDEEPFMYLPVKVKFNDRGPKAYLQAGQKKPTELNEDTIAILDDIDIASVDVDVRPYDWEMPNGNTGRTAYLESILVIQQIDRFASRFEEEI